MKYRILNMYGHAQSDAPLLSLAETQVCSVFIYVLSLQQKQIYIYIYIFFLTTYNRRIKKTFTEQRVFRSADHKCGWNLVMEECGMAVANRIQNIVF